MTDYHSSQVNDIQSSLDRMRYERDIYRQIAQDLYDYFVDGIGTSRAVQRYLQVMRGDFSDRN